MSSKLACRTILVVATSIAAVIAFGDDRLPVPDEANQREAAELVQTVFAEQIRATRTFDDKLALTNKLLEESRRPNTSSDGRYALLRIALDAAPDATAALPILDELAKHFQIDGFKEKASTVWQFSNKARTSSQHKSVASAALQLMEEAAHRDGYVEAMKLGEITLEAAEASKDSRLIRSVEIKMSQVRRDQHQYEEVQTAVATLETDPVDANSNSIVGKYKCFVKGNWEDGLPMLALGDDDALTEVATKELKLPMSSDAQVVLADGWYDLAENSDGQIKERMLQRAGYWYLKSLKSEPTLPRLVRAKVEARLKEVTEVLTSSTTPRLLLGKANGFATEKVIDLRAAPRQINVDNAFQFNSNWSIRVGMFPDSMNQPYQMILFWGDNRGGLDPFYVRLTDNKLEVHCEDVPNRQVFSMNSVESLVAKKWHTVQIDCDTTKSFIYIFLDGKKIYEKRSDVFPVADKRMPWWIGGVNAKQQRFRGLVRNLWIGNPE